jgi:hypothetical protein
MINDGSWASWRLYELAAVSRSHGPVTLRKINFLRVAARSYYAVRIGRV